MMANDLPVQAGICTVPDLQELDTEALSSLVISQDCSIDFSGPFPTINAVNR